MAQVIYGYIGSFGNDCDTKSVFSLKMSKNDLGSVVKVPCPRDKDHQNTSSAQVHSANNSKLTLLSCNNAQSNEMRETWYSNNKMGETWYLFVNQGLNPSHRVQHISAARTFST